MNALITWAAVLLILIFIALIRVGIKARYSEEGVFLQLKIFLFHITLLPKEKDKAKKKKQKKETPKDEKKEKKGGTVDFVLKIFTAAKRVLVRLKKRLRIDELTVHYVSGCDDP